MNETDLKILMICHYKKSIEPEPVVATAAVEASVTALTVVLIVLVLTAPIQKEL